MNVETCDASRETVQDGIAPAVARWATDRCQASDASIGATSQVGQGIAAVPLLRLLCRCPSAESWEVLSGNIDAALSSGCHPVLLLLEELLLPHVSGEASSDGTGTDASQTGTTAAEGRKVVRQIERRRPGAETADGTGRAGRLRSIARASGPAVGQSTAASGEQQLTGTRLL